MVTAEATQADPAATLFDANLAAFKAWAPKLYGRLSALETPNSQLVVDAAGKVDMAFRGQGFYSGDAEAHTNEQLRKFFERPLRQTINEPDPEMLQGACGRLCEALTRRMAEDGIAYDRKHAPLESHSLMIFGVGLGLQVAPLIERTRARVVLLIEPNLEFLYHSLFVVEWHALLERAAEDDRRIDFIVESDSAVIAAIAKQVQRRNNPALVDGIYLYTHYPSVVLEQARDQIRHDLFLTLSGMGFFEDELTMTRNAAGNLCRGTVALLARYHPARPEPLFIVGSGPSVEADLEVIVRHAGRAVIVSIGTALRILLRNGVQPDFHVELENGPGILENAAATAADHDLGAITLIASATVLPEVAALFERRILFFRERVSSTLQFGGTFDALQPAGPTVANAALAAAIRMGFRQLYLFGVDMGSRSGDRFHAPGSVYHDGLRADLTKPSKSFPGNFGGEVTGEAVFNWSRRVLEGAIQAHRSVTVYNCSDGVRIAGAIPKVSRMVELPEEAIDRAALDQALRAKLNGTDLERLRQAWSAGGLRRQTAATFERIEDCLARSAAAPEPTLDWVHEVYEILRPESENGVVASSFLNGTLSICMGSINWYDRRIAEPERRGRFRRIAIEVVQALLHDLKADLEALCDEVDGLISAA